MSTVIRRRRYTKDFKLQAVGLVNLGKPVPEVAQELGLSDGVLYDWVRKLGPASAGESMVKAGGSAESAAEELRRLRREVANLKLENDILKKAAILLGTKPPLGGAR